MTTPRNKKNVGHVPLSHATYVRLKAYCELHGISMSATVEDQVERYLDAQPENLLGETPSVAREMYQRATGEGGKP